MKKLTSITIILSVLILSSCATVFTGNKQTVRFNSNAEGATIKLNTRTIGQTNMPISINRNQMLGLIQVSKEGCVTKEMELPIHMNPAYYGNIPFEFILIGYIGATWDLAKMNHIATEKIIYVELDCTKKEIQR